MTDPLRSALERCSDSLADMMAQVQDLHGVAGWFAFRRQAVWTRAMANLESARAALRSTETEGGVRLAEAMAHALHHGINAWDSGIAPNRKLAIEAMMDALQAWRRRVDAPSPSPEPCPSETAAECAFPAGHEGMHTAAQPGPLDSLVGRWTHRSALLSAAPGEESAPPVSPPGEENDRD